MRSCHKHNCARSFCRASADARQGFHRNSVTSSGGKGSTPCLVVTDSEGAILCLRFYAAVLAHASACSSQELRLQLMTALSFSRCASPRPRHCFPTRISVHLKYHCPEVFRSPRFISGYKTKSPVCPCCSLLQAICEATWTKCARDSTRPSAPQCACGFIRTL